jgi:hypothetical protein
MNNSFTGLNKHLICSIYPMKRVGDGADWERDNSETPFEAPLTQATLDMASNWTSPFESNGVESSFPALAQMAQSGMFRDVLQALGSRIPPESERTKEFIDGVEKSARQLVGRSGVTKLNSTQVWQGAAPIKITVSAFLRAFKSPVAEVEEPIKRLQSWVVPRRLAKDGIISSTIKNGASLLALMPSEVPTIVGFAYKNRIFQPMVIESCSDPLDAPISKYGNRISAVVQLTLCSLTALDRSDWTDTYPAEYL